MLLLPPLPFKKKCVCEWLGMRGCYGMYGQRTTFGIFYPFTVGSWILTQVVWLPKQSLLPLFYHSDEMKICGRLGLPLGSTRLYVSHQQDLVIFFEMEI